MVSYPICFPDKGLVAVHAVDLLAAAGVCVPRPAHTRAARAIVAWMWLTGGRPPTAAMVAEMWPSVSRATVARLLLLAPAHAVPYAAEGAVAA